MSCKILNIFLKFLQLFLFSNAYFSSYFVASTFLETINNINNNIFHEMVKYLSLFSKCECEHKHVRYEVYKQNIEFYWPAIIRMADQ